MTTVDPVGAGLTERPQPGATRGADVPDVAGDRPGGSRLPGVVAAGAAYLALSVALWWGVWSSHPTTTTTCGCGDSSLFTWFLAWPAYALSHGLNPLYSTALFRPTGVNLLANTGEAGIGIVLSPVTLAFGPVATLNVALTLSPALSALALFVLVRRWVTWWPAAFAGGLLYGFSPFALVGLTDAHLMLGFAPVPPLVVLCLDELFVRQRWRPAVTGIAIGLLALVQFFVGTEVLALVAMAAAFGVAALFVYGLWHRDVMRARLRYAAVGGAWALSSTVALLAWPIWFAFAGPAHFRGSIWGPSAPLAFGGNVPRGFVWPLPPSTVTTALGHRFGGYQAPTPSAQYLGIGLILVLAGGLVVWRRDRRLWFFAATGVVTAALSRGLVRNAWTPWRLFSRLPQLESLIPGRFALIVYLCAAVMLAIVADHVRAAVLDRSGRSRATPDADVATAARRRRGHRAAAALAGLIVVGVALAPIGVQLAPVLPITVVPVRLPQWFQTTAPKLPPRQVLLIFPPPFAFRQSALTWQAVNGMHYAQVGGAGPGAIPFRAGREREGQTFLADLAASGSAQAVSPEEVRAVRRALDDWGVTLVVLPDAGSFPRYARVDTVRPIIVLMTAVVGRVPLRQAGAWVWPDVAHGGPPVRPSAGALVSCGSGPLTGSVASLAGSARCVLSESQAGH